MCTRARVCVCVCVCVGEGDGEKRIAARAKSRRELMRGVLGENPHACMPRMRNGLPTGNVLIILPLHIRISGEKSGDKENS